MNRKQFLAQVLKWLLLPLMLIGAGIFIAYALTYLITELKLSDFMVAWIVIPFAVAFIILITALNYLHDFFRNLYKKLPEPTRITLTQYTRFTNQTIDWLFPFVAGGLMYHFWTMGNKTMAFAFAASIIVRKVKEYQNQKNEQHINNVPTHTAS